MVGTVKFPIRSAAGISVEARGIRAQEPSAAAGVAELQQDAGFHLAAAHLQIGPCRTPNLHFSSSTKALPARAKEGAVGKSVLHLINIAHVTFCLRQFVYKRGCVFGG